VRLKYGISAINKDWRELNPGPLGPLKGDESDIRAAKYAITELNLVIGLVFRLHYSDEAQPNNGHTDNVTLELVEQ
jgi:hypothetical protein